MGETLTDKFDKFMRDAVRTEIPQAPKVSPKLSELVDEIIRKSEASEPKPKRPA